MSVRGIIMATYLQVENLTKSYGDRILFSQISFHINQGDKIALVAANGSGKSSLLNVLAGKELPESGGSVMFMKNIGVAYLEQDPVFDPGMSVREHLRRANKKVFKAITAYNTASGSGERKKLEKAISDMDRLGVWNYDQRMDKILTSLKFGLAGRSMGTLSGGEVKKVAIAALLLQDAEFLIMDEPTNHLDIEVIEYLEEYLSASSATLFMVTHDRYFLDRVCNSIYELEDGQLYTYRGNYRLFLEKKEERIANRAAETDKARNLYRRELEWIRSTPCARTGKSKSRKDDFNRLKEKIQFSDNERKIQINAGVARLGGKIIHCKDLSFHYGAECMLKDFSYNFQRYEKIGIIGGNGVGKTTFLKLITGELTPDSGELQLGQTVRFGFYRQEGIQFNPGDTVFDVVHDIAEVVTQADGGQVPVGTFLNRFLFPPPTHQVRVEKLSGGEKRRLYLLTILMRNPNFLILDEPTNDLDILTLNVLEEYLEHFKGCVLIVSHDRYFMDKLADHLFIFQGDGIVRDYPGKCSEYYRTLSIPEGKTSERKKEIRHTPVKKKITYREQKRMEELEQMIQELDREKAELEKVLSDPARPLEEITGASVRMGEILESLEKNWEELLGLEDQRVCCSQ